LVDSVVCGVVESVVAVETVVNGVVVVIGSLVVEDSVVKVVSPGVVIFALQPADSGSMQYNSVGLNSKPFGQS